MKRHVFLSYAHTDEAPAQELLSALEQRGVVCWIAPRDVPPGGSYAEAIIDAIGASTCFVLIYTENANLSPHVLREVERALKFGINIIPIRFDGSSVSKSLDYLLATVHWLSAISPPRETAIHLAAEQIARSSATPAPAPLGQWQDLPRPVKAPLFKRRAFVWTLCAGGFLAAIPPYLIHQNSRIDLGKLSGKWMIIERCNSSLGDYQIIWHYDFQIVGQEVHATGKKVRVNEQPADEKELQAVSKLAFHFRGTNAMGTFHETNFRGDVLRGKVILQFTEDLMSFSGGSYQGDEKSTTLSGFKQS